MKKFLQKSCHWLVMLVAWFAVSATAWAQDAEFDVVGKSNTTQTEVVNGVTWTCHLAAWAGGANFYQYGDDSFTVEAPEGKVITKIQMTIIDGNGGGTGTVDRDGADVGSLSYADGYATWEGESDYVRYTTTDWSRDWSFKHVAVWLADAGEDDGSVKSTLNFDNWNLTYSGGSSKPASSTHFNNGEVFSNAEGVTMTLTNIPDSQSWPSECFYSNPSGSTMALYLCNGEGFTIAAPAGYTLSKILVNRASSSYSMTSLIIDGVQNTDAIKGTWEGEAESVDFSTINGDATKRVLINNIIVTLMPAAAEDTEYTLTFVDAPAGAAVTIDGTTYEENASWTVAKYLNLGSITNVVEPDGYYAEKEYDATDHKFTVTYKHWITYNVTVTGHPMGVLEYNGNYYSADGTSSFQSKTVINDEEFKAYKLNGYDGAVSVTQESDYVYNVSVTYTESAPITYSVVFNTVPEGAYAWINGVKYEANGTFQTNLELNNSNLQEVYCPEGYYDNSYYSADDHTFYINYIEYEKFYVVVEGTEDANAGVKYNYISYHNGDVLYTQNSFYLINYFDYYVTAIEVSGYNVEVSLVDHTITVTYTEKPVQVAPWEVNVASIFNDCTVIDNNGDGKKWVMNGDEIYYPYHGSNAGDDYIVLTPVRLEGGKTYTVSVETHQMYSYAERIEVLYGKGNTISALTNTAIVPTDVTWNDYKNISADVTIEEDGVYYFAIHAISPADLYNLYVKKFSVTAPAPRECVMTLTPMQPNIPGEVSSIRSNLSFTCDVNTEGAHYGFDTPNEVPEGVTLKDDNNVSYTISNMLWWDNDNQVAINLPAAITTPGTYTLTIPEGVIPCINNKANKAMTFTWTVLDPVVGHLAMSDAGYATLCVNYAYTLPEGYTAYAAGKDVNGTATLVGEDGSIILNPLNSVAANVPVIIEGPEADDVTLLRASSASAPAVNFLVGFTYEANNWSISNTFGTDWCPGSPMDYDTFSNFSIYQLANDNEEGKVGFYRQKAEEGKFYCAANKAVLIVPAPDAESNARFLLPGQEVITGIDSVIATEAAENIFNLQGQRVIAPAKGGVYVKNGKKIIVK